MSDGAMVYTAVSFYMDWICIPVMYQRVSDTVMLFVCECAETNHAYIYKVDFPLESLASQTFSMRALGTSRC